MHVDVAVAGRRVHHRHRRDLLQRRLQAPRPRAGSPGPPSPPPSPAPPAPPGRPRAAPRSPPAARRPTSASRTSAASAPFEPLGIARAPQHDRVARLQAERRAVHRHVRPRLVDHGDDAKRNAQLAHLDPAREAPAVDLLADRVGSATIASTPAAIASTRSAVSAGDREAPRSALCPLVRQIRRVRREHVFGAARGGAAASRGSAASF